MPRGAHRSTRATRLNRHGDERRRIAAHTSSIMRVQSSRVVSLSQPYRQAALSRVLVCALRSSRSRSCRMSTASPTRCSGCSSICAAPATRLSSSRPTPRAASHPPTASTTASACTGCRRGCSRRSPRCRWVCRGRGWSACCADSIPTSCIWPRPRCSATADCRPPGTSACRRSRYSRPTSRVSRESYGIGVTDAGRLGVDPASAPPRRPHAGAVHRGDGISCRASVFRGCTTGRAASTSSASCRRRATTRCGGTGHRTASRSSASSAGWRRRSTSSGSRRWPPRRRSGGHRRRRRRPRQARIS